MHTYTHTHKHIDYTKLNLHSLKRAANRLEMDWDSSTEQKTWQVYSLGNRNVFRLDLNESREGFCWRGRVRSFHVDGPKNQKGAEINSGESSARNLEAEGIRSRAESTESARRVCKVEDSHRGKTEQCPWYIIAKSVYLVLDSSSTLPDFPAPKTETVTISRQFSFINVYPLVCCLEKGVNPKYFCMFCVVLLKSVFFSLACSDLVSESKLSTLFQIFHMT